MTNLEIRQARIDALKDKLRARDGNPAYVKNCEAIREEIARLELVQQSADL